LWNEKLTNRARTAAAEKGFMGYLPREINGNRNGNGNGKRINGLSTVALPSAKRSFEYM